jgi:predicted secreted protein
MAMIRGLDCSVTWASAEILYIRDCNLELTADEIDNTSRASAGWKDTRPGLLNWRMSATLVRETGDTAYDTLQAAFLAKTSGTVVFDEDSGSWGLTGTAYVTELRRSEPIDGVVTIDLTLVGAGAIAGV